MQNIVRFLSAALAQGVKPILHNLFQKNRKHYFDDGNVLSKPVQICCPKNIQRTRLKLPIRMNLLRLQCFLKIRNVMINKPKYRVRESCQYFIP